MHACMHASKNDNTQNDAGHRGGLQRQRQRHPCRKSGPRRNKGRLAVATQVQQPVSSSLQLCLFSNRSRRLPASQTRPLHEPFLISIPDIAVLRPVSPPGALLSSVSFQFVFPPCRRPSSPSFATMRNPVQHLCRPPPIRSSVNVAGPLPLANPLQVNPVSHRALPNLHTSSAVTSMIGQRMNLPVGHGRNRRCALHRSRASPGGRRIRIRTLIGWDGWNPACQRGGGAPNAISIMSWCQCPSVCFFPRPVAMTSKSIFNGNNPARPATHSPNARRT